MSPVRHLMSPADDYAPPILTANYEPEYTTTETPSYVPSPPPYVPSPPPYVSSPPPYVPSPPPYVPSPPPYVPTSPPAYDSYTPMVPYSKNTASQCSSGTCSSTSNDLRRPA